MKNYSRYYYWPEQEGEDDECSLSQLWLSRLFRICASTFASSSIWTICATQSPLYISNTTKKLISPQIWMEIWGGIVFMTLEVYRADLVAQVVQLLPLTRVEALDLKAMGIWIHETHSGMIINDLQKIITGMASATIKLGIQSVYLGKIYYYLLHLTSSQENMRKN